jgi:hypothetical protein
MLQSTVHNAIKGFNAIIIVVIVIIIPAMHGGAS